MRRRLLVSFLPAAVAASAGVGGCQTQTANPAATRPAALMALAPLPAAEPTAAEPPSRPDRPQVPGAVAVAVPAADAQQPPVGRPCRVHFRRDALGLSSPAPLSIASESLVGRAVVLAGTLRELTPDWLVVESNGSTYWVPRAAILLLEFTDKK